MRYSTAVTAVEARVVMWVKTKTTPKSLYVVVAERLAAAVRAADGAGWPGRRRRRRWLDARELERRELCRGGGPGTEDANWP